MGEEKPPSIKASMMHLAVLFMITAFIAGIAGCVLQIGTVPFFVIAAVLFVMAGICFAISRRYRDTP